MGPDQRSGEGDDPLEHGQAMLTGLSAALALDRLVTNRVLITSRIAIARSTELVAACRQGMPHFGDSPISLEDKAGRRAR
jgi:hypothetical protein